MIAKTHVLGGTLFALGGYACLKATGNLLPDVSEVLQVGVILPYAIWTSTVPDFDRQDDNMASRSPINFAIQKFFKLIGAGHRSEKSHVIPIIVSVLLYTVINLGFFWSEGNSLNLALLNLITLGCALGLASHFVLDIMTQAGIKVGRVTIRLVPDLDIFGTNTFYETVVQKILYVLIIVFFILIIMI